MDENPKGDQFLCAKHEVSRLLHAAEHTRDQLLAELQHFYTGNITVRVYPVQHTMGWSIAADLEVNGEACRTYDPADLCFLDLNEMMMRRMIQQGIGPVA